VGDREREWEMERERVGERECALNVNVTSRGLRLTIISVEKQ
jgi:hypothetical protein